MTAQVVKLISEQTGDEVSILVSQGFNCFSWTCPNAASGREILWATDAFASGTERASSCGIPILFPFPGRLRGTQFSWNGQQYDLEPGDAFGNAIHGFVHTRAWRVVEQSSHSVTAEIQASIDDPELLEKWPGDFHLVASYEFVEGGLRFDWTVTNRGDEDLPYGLGVHPYFRIESLGGDLESCKLQVPVDEVWALDDMLPTGGVNPDPFGLKGGITIEGKNLDHVFASSESILKSQNSAFLCGAQGQEIRVSYGEEYPFCVVYTPDHREAICIEPYTCLPNSPEFLEGDRPTGWRLLKPGASFSSTLTYAWT